MMQTKKSPLRIAVALAVFHWFAVIVEPTKADFMISFGNTSILSGGNGSIDAFISSDVVGGEKLNTLSCLFEISAAAPGTTGVAEFLQTQSASERSDSNYVFFNDLGFDGFSYARQDPNFKTQLVQSDFSFTATGTTITVPQLLARLEIQQLSPVANGTFRISLKEDAGNTFFLNGDGLVGIASVSYSNFGIITSTISAVPEPASCVLCGLALTLVAVRRLRAKKSLKLE